MLEYMKNKILITVTTILAITITVILFIYIKNQNISIQGSYQGNDSEHITQLVIDGNKFTEYIDSKVVNIGSIKEQEKNTFILDSSNGKYFLYKEGKNNIFFRPNSQTPVLILKKMNDTPTYITD